MRICVYGKLDGTCGLCESAKDKLKRMGVKFETFELADMVTLHEGWREDDSVEVLACYSAIQTYPVITIEGKAMSYPEAMKILKASRKLAEPEAAPVYEPVPYVDSVSAGALAVA